MAKSNPPRSTRSAAARRTGSRTPVYATLIALAVLAAGIVLWRTRRSAGARGEDAAAIYQALAANPQSAGPPQPYTLGDSTAPVVLEEFGDFECPSCGRFATITEPDVRTRLVQTGQVYFKYYDLPLPNHGNSRAASNAAACAAEQGKFWEMHDRIFSGQPQWGLGPNETEVTSDPVPVFRTFAQAAGVNVDQWQACMDARKYQGRVNANLAEGLRRNIEQTPTFYINGKMVAGAIPFDEVQRLVTEAARDSAGRRAAGGAPAAAAPVPPRPEMPVPADTAGIAKRTIPPLRGRRGPG